MKTPKFKIIIEVDDEPHDEKTCFRCRLHELFLEVNAKNDPRFMTLSMAEAAGSMLSQLPPEDKTDFMMLLMRTYHEDLENIKSAENETKH